MTSSPPAPFFSVIIPTRNRCALFKIALDSVLAQDCGDVEVIVVNDGSTGADLDAYHALERDYTGRASFHYLVHRPNGHGQSYSMNFGAGQARGRFLCFLDDDDAWIDPHHLQRAKDAIEGQSAATDLYFTDQRALFSDGRPNNTPLWISGVERFANAAPDATGSYRMSAEAMLQAGGFAHLNCSIYRREFWLALGGMDENIRYECDRDIYMRGIDAADGILYNPAVVSEHNIPDPKKSSNMSTAISIFEKKIYQLRVFDKAILLSRTPAVVAFSKRAKAYELKKIATTLVDTGRYADAAYYIRETLLLSFSPKWLGYFLYCHWKRLASGAKH
ncbi:glycosyltransferase family 2 protein [Denitromonas sp.]|uniref:glycosyltransferase family 2 protein n=2 Tax=Denitromonas sp. TaxID=2734609 RepID=UPI003A864E79